MLIPIGYKVFSSLPKLALQFPSGIILYSSDTFTDLYFVQGFREGRFPLLIATDVAARGLDIPEVDLVIQCEPPKVIGVDLTLL